MSAYEMWKDTSSVLFLWSLFCFSLGVAFAGILYHYYISSVIRRAERMIEKMGDRPLTPPGKENT